MNKEQEILKYLSAMRVIDFNKLGFVYGKETIDDVLNLMKQLQEENKQQDKMIDEMAEYIATLDIEEDICSKTENEHCDKMNFGECEDCIKQYFKKKAQEIN